MGLAEHRKSERTNLDLPAKTTVGGAESSCVIDNISSTGAGLSGRVFVNTSVGQRIELIVPGVGNLNATIKWKGMSGVGVEFDRQNSNLPELRKYVAALS